MVKYQEVLHGSTSELYINGGAGGAGHQDRNQNDRGL